MVKPKAKEMGFHLETSLEIDSEMKTGLLMGSGMVTSSDSNSVKTRVKDWHLETEMD